MTPPLTLRQRVSRLAAAPTMPQTFTYYAAFVALGLTTSSLGPTLLGLAGQTGSQLAQISFLFTARALGYLVGSFVGGRLFDRLPGNRTMAGALLVAAVLLALVPSASLLWVLTAVLLAVGAMEGIVDVGGNTLIVWVHRDKVPPYMNGLHLFFAIGAFLSPLLIGWAIMLTGNFGAGYWLLALLLIPVIIRLLPLPNPEPIVSRAASAATQAAARPPLYLLTLVVLFFLLYAGAEQSFSGWVFTYAVKANLTNETMATYVNAAYWGAFTVGRIVAIPIAIRVRPRVIMVADLVIALTGLAVLLFFTASPAALWVGTILVGLGIASGFPTMIIFAGRHMTITGAVTGWFFVGASLGGMILPWLIGQLFEPLGPSSVMLVIGGALILALGVFILVLARVGSTPDHTPTLDPLLESIEL